MLLEYILHLDKATISITSQPTGQLPPLCSISYVPVLACGTFPREKKGAAATYPHPAAERVKVCTKYEIFHG